MEDSGEQCTVVFAQSVKEPHSIAGSVTIHAKTTVHCSPGSSMGMGMVPVPDPLNSLDGNIFYDKRTQFLQQQKNFQVPNLSS